MKAIVLIISILLLNVNGSFAQEHNENSLFKTFKKITELDQSHIRKNNIRDSLILLNFSKIKELLSSDINLNSEQKLKNKTKKKLKSDLLLTFLHVLQIDPRLLLNDETVEFFAQYIDKNLISNRQLKSALVAYNYDIEIGRWTNWTAYFDERIEFVKVKWKIN